MFEQTFKNIDDVLWKEAGCTTELDYVEQTSWLLFLKYLDDLEKERVLQAELANRVYYTPRPLIRAMIEVVKPTLNDRIYDGACGSGGFLCEAFDYLKDQAKSTRDMDWLQTKALTGKEKKSLAYVAYVRPPETREERVALRRSAILDGLSDAQREFLDFVLSQYVSEGEDELDPEKLPGLLNVKYGSASDGLQQLGASVREVQEAFRGFQGKLYSEEPKN